MKTILTAAILSLVLSSVANAAPRFGFTYNYGPVAPVYPYAYPYPYMYPPAYPYYAPPAYPYYGPSFGFSYGGGGNTYKYYGSPNHGRGRR